MSLLQNKQNFHVDPVLGDCSLTIDDDLLVLDSCGFDVLESFLRAGNSFADCSVKAFSRGHFDLGDTYN